MEIVAIVASFGSMLLIAFGVMKTIDRLRRPDEASTARPIPKLVAVALGLGACICGYIMFMAGKGTVGIFVRQMAMILFAFGTYMIYLAASTGPDDAPKLPERIAGTAYGSSIQATPKSVFILVLLLGGGVWISLEIGARRVAGTRTAILSGTAADLGLQAVSSDELWGVMMERGTKRGSASYLALSDGRAVVFLLPDGIMVQDDGRRPEAQVLQAAQAFITTAMTYRVQQNKSFESPLPAPGEVNFYFLSDGSRRRIAVRESELVEGHVFRPLFDRGIALGVQMRRATGPPEGVRAPEANPRW